MTKRKPLQKNRFALPPLHFRRAGSLWLPRLAEPLGDSTANKGPIIGRFEDREPADFIQIEQTGRGEVLNRFHKGTLVADVGRAEKLRLTYGRVCRVRAEFETKHVFDYTSTPRDLGRIRFVANGVEVVPHHAVVEHVYVRPGHAKREKVLNRVLLHGIGPTFSIHRELERLGRFFAVDSHAVPHQDGRILVTSICEGFVKSASSEHALLNWEYVRTLLVPAPKELPEQHGWALALHWLESSKLIDAGRHLGLVVDCDLGRLEAYASRKEPVLPGWELPAFVTLVYATSNAGTREFLPNKMIAAADTFNRAAARRARKRRFAELWPKAKPGLLQICAMYVARRPEAPPPTPGISN